MVETRLKYLKVPFTFITLAVAISLLPSTASAAQKVAQGVACKSVGQKVSISSVAFTCIKSGKKLIWSKLPGSLASKAPSIPLKPSPSSTPIPSPSTKSASFLTPLMPSGTDPITWQNISDRYDQIAAAAWQSTQETLKANAAGVKTSVVKVLYAPQTDDSHYPGFESYLKVGVQLWNRFILPPKTTFLVYSYAEIPWAKTTITKILVDDGMQSNQAIQIADNLSHAPYGGPDCGGANAGMITDSQAIGVFALCARNESTDPYYMGPLQIHEFTHQIQGAQFIGSKFHQQEILPCWISEGLAHAAGISAGTASINAYQVVRKLQAAHPMLNVAGGHDQSQLDLAAVDYDFILKFYNESAPPGCFQLPSYSLGYSLGFFTTEALSSIGGIESTALLYSRTASGESFEEAFKNVYGIPWNDAKVILAKTLAKEFSALKS